MRVMRAHVLSLSLVVTAVTDPAVSAPAAYSSDVRPCGVSGASLI